MSNFINTNVGTYGRFGNQFFRNMCAHFICLKNDLRFEYSMEREMNCLGFRLYHGTRKYDRTFYFEPIPIPPHKRREIGEYQKESFMSAFETPLEINIDLSKIYAQTREFALYLRTYIERPIVKESIILSNPYRERYHNNNEVFIHVRLGDAPQHNPGLKYYMDVLNSLHFSRGWIASDSLEHPLCQTLIRQFGLTKYIRDEVDTIHFGSTCRNIVLSNGTFSWMIGFLSNAGESTVYYPRINTPWHGNIFVFPDWIERPSGAV